MQVASPESVREYPVDYIGFDEDPGAPKYSESQVEPGSLGGSDTASPGSLDQT